jgi:hypothetical protein
MMLCLLLCMYLLALLTKMYYDLLYTFDILHSIFITILSIEMMERHLYSFYLTFVIVNFWVHYTLPFPLYADSGNEMASTSSDTLDSSIIHKDPMHLTFKLPEPHPPVPTEAYSLMDGQSTSEPSLSISVIGATGELVRSKVFPALFALYYSGFLPQV